MTLKQLKNSFLLLIAAAIWGTAFVAQSVGMDYVEPFTFCFSRSIIGCVVLIPIIYLFGRKDKTSQKENTEKSSASFLSKNRILIFGGIACGICLFAASNLQQFGIMTSTAGKAGFITACYIIIVPVLGIFLKRKTSPLIWLGVVIALVGMFFLCIMPSIKNDGGFSFQPGDIQLILCSICFSFHILVIDHFSPKTNGIKLSCIQFLVCGILSGVCMLIFETPSMENILNAWLPIMYAGAMSSGIAFTLQIIAQKDLHPTVASLIMSLESVISVLAGFVILNEVLSTYEIIGCVLMFIAIILAQISPSDTSTANTEATKNSY
ncbi:MAG: DMT family transporter [Lachnospiraceae bacterium]|nr:DMT family transporter [Lachnospiraceae bacterium]